ncbi:MAG TPA: hypothetical protein VHV82_18400 [Sporichthyaceae bacterium]|nr:hypothetical protein [Sporichthyaceae bacterium]
MDEEGPSRTRRLGRTTRIGIIALALGLLGGAMVGAVRTPPWTPLYAVLAFAGVGVLLLLRDARVSLSGDHLIVQNLLRVYALPLAGIRRSVAAARGGVALVVYFHPDYPPWPGGPLPHGWRAKHRRKRLRQIRVFALIQDDELLSEILHLADDARDAIERGRATD